MTETKLISRKHYRAIGRLGRSDGRLLINVDNCRRGQVVTVTAKLATLMLSRLQWIYWALLGKHRMLHVTLMSISV